MQLAAASLTVKVAPPIVSVPLRALVVEFAAAENATVPLPEPLAPDVIVNHESLLAAVQLQPASVVTPVDPVPPAAVTD